MRPELVDPIVPSSSDAMPHIDAAERVRWWGLIAPNLPQGTRERYHARQRERLLPAARTMLAFAAMLTLAVGYLDTLAHSDQLVAALVIRGIGAALMLTLVLLTRFVGQGDRWNRYLALSILLGQVTLAAAATRLPDGFIWGLPGMMLLPLIGMSLLVTRREALIVAVGCVAIVLYALSTVDADRRLWQAVGFFVIVASLCGYLLHELFERIRRRAFLLEEKLTHAATLDGLTGLANRRHFVELGERFLARAWREHKPLSAVYLDIDHFKKINDIYGHPVGDEALQAMVLACLVELRPGDLFGRLGGEEFCVLLPNCSLANARRVAERLRLAVSRMVVADQVRFTISLGIAETLGAEEPLEALLKRADQALYQAKHNGRNRVEVSLVLRATPGGGT